MKLGRIVEELGLELICGSTDLEIENGCVGDLLSEVMRSCRSDSIWVTVQSHVNIVAVAVVVGIRAIVLCNGYDYDEKTVQKAKEEGIALLRTEMDPFVTAGRIYSLISS